MQSHSKQPAAPAGGNERWKRGKMDLHPPTHLAAQRSTKTRGRHGPPLKGLGPRKHGLHGLRGKPANTLARGQSSKAGGKGRDITRLGS